MKAENMEEQVPLDLKIRTKQFALRIIRLYTSLPKTNEAQVIGKQVCVQEHQLERNIVRRNAQSQMLISSTR